MQTNKTAARMTTKAALYVPFGIISRAPKPLISLLWINPKERNLFPHFQAYTMIVIKALLIRVKKI